MRTIFKQAILVGSVFALSACATFLCCYQEPTADEGNTIIDVPATNQEKLLASMTSLSSFAMDANIDITFDRNELHADIVGQGSLSSLDGIMVGAEVAANYEGLSIEGNLSYFNDIIYFDYGNNYFKLESSSLLEFITMLPGKGITIDMPNELTNFNLNDFEEKFMNMEEIQSPTGYMYALELSDLVIVYFNANWQNEFTGLKTNKFYYNNMYFYIEADIEELLPAEITITDPSIGPHASQYQNFAPALDLFNGCYALFEREQNRIAFDVDLDVNGKVFGADGAVSYDMENGVYALEAGITENGRVHNFDLGYKNATAYYDYNDVVKVSIKNDSVGALINYVIYKIGDDNIAKLIDELTKMTEDQDMTGLLDTVKGFDTSSIIDTITIQDGEISISIDPSAFNLDAEEIIVTTDFSEELVNSITISNIVFGGISGNIVISCVDYIPFTINDADFAPIDPALTLIDTFEELAKDTQFRIELEGLMDNSDASATDVTIDGGLQFDIENHFGYGEATIVDPTDYTHNLKVDMRSPEEVLFAYNSALLGKFSTHTLLEVVDLFSEMFEEKDDHFMELFGELLNAIKDTPIMQAINTGDYGAILATGLISDIAITDTTIDLRLSAALLGLSSYMDIHIDYDEENFYALSVSNFVYENSTMSFTLRLKKFDDSLSSTRLDPFKNYLDFSDIRVLIELGINTSKFNYYHFTATAGIVASAIGLNLINMSIPLDVRIYNDQGNVSIAVELPEVPIITAVNTNGDYYGTSDRSASIYYREGLFYLKRTETVKTKFFLSRYGTYTLTSVCTTDYFLDNIMYYACDFILGFKQFILDKIEDTSVSTAGEQIHYENILKDFSYNQDLNYFDFLINMEEIAKSDMFSDLSIRIYEDVANKRLSSLNVNLAIKMGLKLAIDLNLAFVNPGEAFDLNTMNAFVTAHSGDAQNTTITIKP